MNKKSESLPYRMKLHGGPTQQDQLFATKSRTKLDRRTYTTPHLGTPSPNKKKIHKSSPRKKPRVYFIKPNKFPLTAARRPRARAHLRRSTLPCAHAPGGYFIAAIFFGARAKRERERGRGKQDVRDAPRARS